MQSDNIKDSGRYIVSEQHYGSILPGNRAEMWRDVYLESGAVIKGGIFGNNLTVVNPDVMVEESVYVRGEIKIRPGQNIKDRDIVFGSNVVSPDSLVVEEAKSIVRFNSDIYVNKLNIHKSIIYGNIYCNSAILNNCILLGGIYCKKNLSIENSILYTFDTDVLEVKNNVSLLSPMASARKPFHLECPVKALTFYNIINQDQEESFIELLSDDDIIEVNMNIDKETGLREKRYILSMAERILNSTEIIKSFRQNKRMIELLSLGSHLDKEYTKELESFKKEDFEKELWSIIDKDIETTTHEKRANLNDVLRKIYA